MCLDNHTEGEWGAVERRRSFDKTRLLFGTFYLSEVGLLSGTSDVSEVGLLSGIPPQEHAQVPATEPRGPYLYVRASTTRACGVWHQILGWLLAGAHVLQSLARHRPLVCFKLL